MARRARIKLLLLLCAGTGLATGYKAGSLLAWAGSEFDRWPSIVWAVALLFITLLALISFGELALQLRLFHASTPVGASAHLAEFIDAAKTRVILVDGGDEPYWVDGPHVAAIDEAASRGVTVEIIIGPYRGPGTESIEDLGEQEGVELYKLSWYPASHFAVVDGRRWLLQAPHPHGGDAGFSKGQSTSLMAGPDLERAFTELRSQASNYSAIEANAGGE